MRRPALATAGLTLALAWAFLAYVEPANVWRWSYLISLCQ